MDQIRKGKLIAAKRRQAGLTQLQLAEKLNVTDRAVSKWENGRSLPDVENIEPLCRILGITLQQFYGSDDADEEIQPDNDSNSDHSNRVKLIIVLVGVAVLMVISMYRDLQKGLYLGEAFYRKESENIYRNYSDSITIDAVSDGAVFRISEKGRTHTVVMQAAEPQYIFTYNGQSRVTVDYSQLGLGSSEYYLMDEERQYFIGVSPRFSFDDVNDYGVLYETLFRAYKGDVTIRRQPAISFLAAILLALSAVGFIMPQKLHFLGRSWAYRNPQLSREGVAFERISALICAALALSLMFVL